ncbi:MAG: Dabb family protein [Vallitaleaceae bacterium]|nr:Dabb family protein [Vallitaleaceae bacterium]
MEEKVLRHVVLFKFKAHASKDAISKCEKTFMELKNRVRYIKSLEWGVDVSPENLSQGFTHCFFLSFESEADRDAYLLNNSHKELGRLLDPILDKALVVDYWA